MASTAVKVTAIIGGFVVLIVLAILIAQSVKKSNAPAPLNQNTTTTQTNPGLIGDLSSLTGVLAGLFGHAHGGDNSNTIFCQNYPNDSICTGIPDPNAGTLGDYCTQYPDSILCQG